VLRDGTHPSTPRNKTKCYKAAHDRQAGCWPGSEVTHFGRQLLGLSQRLEFIPQTRCLLVPPILNGSLNGYHQAARARHRRHALMIIKGKHKENHKTIRNTQQSLQF
jgi:hypothetical protein